MLTLTCTEAELTRVTSLLESHGAAYEASYLGSSSFPSLDVSERKCQVLVFGELTGELHDQLTEIVGTEAVHASSDTPKAKKRSWKRMLLVGYAVVVTLGWTYTYYLYRHTMEDKNFTYSWNLEGTTLDCNDKRTGKLVSRYIDRNYNFSFEEGVQYYSNGHLSVMRDQDEDGFYETLTYTTNGQLAQEWLDLDRDGQYESGQFILENGDTLQLTDSDADGFFEIVR